MLRCKWMHLLMPHLRHVHGLTDVARDHAPPYCLLERPVQDSVRILNGPSGEPTVLHLPVEPLDVSRGERLKPDAPNGWGYVAPCLAAIGPIRASADAALYGIFKPAVQVRWSEGGFVC